MSDAPLHLALDDGQVDLRRRTVVHAGVEAAEELTTKEAALLAYLAERPGVVVSFEELHDEVWQMAAAVVSRAAYFTWRRLVRKIEPDPAHPRNLVSHHGDGVSYRPPAPRAPAAARAWSGAAGPLVGRASLLDAVRGHLAAGARLVTLLGPAGAGKSRLARHLASSPAGAGTEAAVAELAEATSGEEVAAAVAVALGGRPEQVLGAGPRLLVLDGAERVAEAVTSAATTWLARSPGLQILVTSRVRLDVPAEQVVAVGGLARSDARALFEQRARAADDGYDAARHHDAIDELLDALDDLPLAIELTAAQVRLLPPRALLRAAEARRGALGGGADPAALGGPGLAATVARSWALLRPCEQAALAELSVFRGGATLAAADAVLSPGPGGSSLDVLQRLLDHSLLRVDPSSREPRYGPWAPVKAWAAARLAEEPARARAARERHARFFAALGPPGLSGHPGLRVELPNLLAAAEHEDPALATAAELRAVSVLAECGPLGDAEARVLRAVSRAPPPLAGWARLQQARVVQFGGRLAEALELAEAVAASAEDPALLGSARLRAGTASLNLGRLDAAAEHLDAAADALATRDPWQHASALLLLGVAHTRAGRWGRALQRMREALAVARRTGDAASIDSVRRELARLQMRAGQARSAELTLRSVRAENPSPILDFHLASSLFLQARWADAAAVLADVTRDTGRRGLVLHELSAQLLLGLCWLELGEIDALGAACDRAEVVALEVDHPNDPIRFLRAAHLARTGRLDEAVALVEPPPRAGGDRLTEVVLYLLVAEVHACRAGGAAAGGAAAGGAALAQAHAVARAMDVTLDGVHPGWRWLAQRLQQPAHGGAEEAAVPTQRPGEP